MKGLAQNRNRGGQSPIAAKTSQKGTVPFSASQPNDPEFEQLIEQITAQLQDDEPIDIEQLAADYPHYADRVRELLPAMEMLARLGEAPPERAATAAFTRVR